MNVQRFFGWVMTFCVICAAASAAERGLAAHYPFNEGEGAVIKDASGNGRDAAVVGTGRWVAGPYGKALDLDGGGTYVNCGAAEAFNIAASGTFMLWCKPRALQGGLINWSTGGGWSDERLVLAFNTYHGGRKLMLTFADGGTHTSIQDFHEPEIETWVHLAVAFNSATVTIYVNGLPARSGTQSLEPLLAGVPLWIGRCQGLGIEHFQGLVDEVRIYNRALSDEEVLQVFKREAEGRDLDLRILRQVGLTAEAVPGPGVALVTLDARGVRPLPAGARLRVEVLPAQGTPLTRDIEKLPDQGVAEETFDVQSFPAGEFTVKARIIDRAGKMLGEESSVKTAWTGQSREFAGVKVLNNLCWEVLSVSEDKGDRYAFALPMDRWVFLSATATNDGASELWVAIDGDGRDQAVLRCTGAGDSTPEAMRFLKAGAHELRIGRKGATRLKALTVRAIPMLQHAFYGANPHIAPYGPYDWAFLAKDVLPNVNTMISSGAPAAEHIAWWKEQGRQWIGITGIGYWTMPEGPDPVAPVFKNWSESVGMTHPQMDGIIIDEFGGGNDPVYDVYRQAVERMAADPRFKGRSVTPYGGAFYGKDRSSEFARVCIATGGTLASERYLQEQPNEAAAHSYIRGALTGDILQWRAWRPDILPHICLVLGYMSQPTESLNIDPSADYRVFMDMQMRTLATHPAYFALGGIQWYHSSYCDEENVRLAGRLFRHYVIEGRTDPFLRDPYTLPHVQNPDFLRGTDGWTITPAEAGSVEVRRHRGYSWLQGRYPRTAMGDTFLWMKRSSQRPNTFAQALRNLEPGRLYSLKMISSDYQDLVQEKSEKKLLGVSIKLDNVELLSGPKQSFQFIFPNCYAHTLGKFDARYNYWMNYHWQIFRAKGTTGRITVSDWKNPREPGGPAGQEILCNFIEVQPYLGE